MEALADYVQPFFAWLLETTLVAGLVICLILAAQKLLGGRLGPRWCHALWLVLLVRMVLPWAPPSPISLFSLIPASTQSTRVQESDVADAPPRGHPRSAETSDSTEADTASEPPVPEKLVEAELSSEPVFTAGLRRILPALWLGGAALLGGYLFAGNFALWRIVKREHPLISQPTLELFEACEAQMGIQTILGIVPTDRVKSPALFGFVRPRLLLPQGMIETLSQEELRYVLLHELAHLKRHDIYIGWLMSLLQVLHWFNPLIWLAFYRMRSDRELACDALVLTRTGRDESHAYGRTMVGLLERLSRSRRLPAMAGILERKSQLKRRIAMIARFKNNSYRWSPLSAIVIVVLACLALPDAPHGNASAEPSGPTTLRQVWSGPGVDAYGGPSPNGRYLSYTDWDTGDLAAREIATGKTRRLTEGKKGGKENFRFALNSVISPDGELIAYSWTNEHGTYDLCVIGIDGSGDRTLYSSKDHELYPACWSSDGRQILARKYKTFGAQHGKSEIISAAVHDGATQVIKDFDEGLSWNRVSYSPDDQFIVYQFSVSAESDNYDIGLYDISAKEEVTLVEHPANDRLLGWVPHRQEILFLSDRAGTHDVWAITVANGKPQGPLRAITRDIGQITPHGFTQDGTFYFNRYTRRFTTLIAPFDVETGEIQEEMAKPLLGSNSSVVWSLDGEKIAYVEEQTEPAGPGFYHRPLHIRDVKTGRTRELAGHIEVRAPHWSPDGRSILVTGFDRNRRKERGYRGGLYKIDVRDDEVTQLVQFPADRYWWTRFAAQWSLDRRAIYYRTANGIAWRDLKSGQEKLLYESNHLGRAFRLSPDGRKLAFSEEVREEGTGRILIILTSGGEPTELCGFDESKGGIQVPKDVTWTPDGNYILFARPAKRGSTVFRVSSEGGDPRVIGRFKDRVSNLSVHPSARDIAISTYMQEHSIWVMEAFLPQEEAK